MGGEFWDLIEKGSVEIEFRNGGAFEAFAQKLINAEDPETEFTRIMRKYLIQFKSDQEKRQRISEVAVAFGGNVTDLRAFLRRKGIIR